MDDLISRQAAIDAVRAYLSDCCVEDGDYHASGIEYELNELPSAQPEQRWIPCSERLPEESIKQIMLGDEHTSDFVLVTIKGQTYPYPKTKVRVARYSYTYNAWQVANNNLGKVVAWMPLPEPYKGGEQDG